MGFELSQKWPDLFGYMYEIPSEWNLEQDGPIHEHKPSIFLKHTEDISIKYALMRIAFKKTRLLLKAFSEKYDKSRQIIELDEEYWELVLYLNSLVIEARSILDVLQKIHILLYPKLNLPDSFRKMLVSEEHLTKLPNDMYREWLKSLQQQKWAEHLMTIDQRSSLRDKLIHYAQLIVRIRPNKKNKLEYFINISKKTQHFVHNARDYPLETTLGSIMLGIDQLIKCFKMAYTKDDLVELLSEM